jgi:hypothetical protein
MLCCQQIESLLEVAAGRQQDTARWQLFRRDEASGESAHPHFTSTTQLIG